MTTGSYYCARRCQKNQKFPHAETIEPAEQDGQAFLIVAPGATPDALWPLVASSQCDQP